MDLSAKYPIDFKKLLDTIDECDLLRRREKQFGKIMGELFPE